MTHDAEERISEAQVGNLPKRIKWQVDLDYVVLMVFFALVFGAVVGLVLQLGTWPTEDRDRWQVVDSLGSALAGVSAFGGLGAVMLGVRSLRATAEQHRLEYLPYMRLYAGFSCELRSSAFRPPEEHKQLLVLAPEDVMENMDADFLKSLHSGNGQIHMLSLWIENVQNAPLGIGFEIELTAVLEWSREPNQPPLKKQLTMKIPYVSHNQPIRVDLQPVGSEVEYLGMVATAIRYKDATGRSFSGGTGPGRFVYDGKDQEVINGPVVLGRA